MVSEKGNIFFGNPCHKHEPQSEKDVFGIRHTVAELGSA